MTDASQLTLETFAVDMHFAYRLLQQVSDASTPVTLDIRLDNPTANFRSRNTRARIWLREAIDLCVRHGIELPRWLRRVTKAERAEYAAMLAVHVVCAQNAARDAVEQAEVDAIDITIDAPAMGALIRMPHFYMEPKMFQRAAVIVSILALCLASVSCLAHAVASV